MKKYTSRIGPELVVPVIAALGLIVYLSFANQSVFLGITSALIVAYFTYLYFSTTYIIHDQKLTVRCGFLVNKTIEIKTITGIKKVTDISSIPAFSIFRLQIQSPGIEDLAISPRHQPEFINDLLAINSNIKLNQDS